MRFSVYGLKNEVDGFFSGFGIASYVMAKITLNKWIIVFTVVTASMLQLIDTSIVNVTLSDMMGNLGATFSEIGWVITGYAAANVVMIVLSGWMSFKLGRKNYFTASIILFTVASFLCGNANTISELIIFRVIQGLGGGGLLSTSQTILVESFPREDLGMANAIFGMSVVLGPAFGPTLGGYITDHLSWHWVFYINIPVGMLAAMLSILFIREPQESIRTGKMDWLAFALLVIGIGSLQVVLENGEREDWFSTTYIIVLTVAAVIGGLLFIWREVSVKSPILNLKLLRYQRFGVGTFFAFMRGFGQYGSLFVIPVFCQNLLGYTAEQTGLLLLPGSLASGIMMPVVGQVMKKTKISPIILAAMGFIIYIIFLLMLSDMSLDTGPSGFLFPVILRGIAGGLLFIPLTTITLYDLKNVEMPQGTAFLNTARQLGGSFGIAIMATFLTTRSAFHAARLNPDVNLYDPETVSRIKAMVARFMQNGLDYATAKAKALTALHGMIGRQAMILTYNDSFYVISVFFLLCIPLLLFFIRKKKKKGILENEKNRDTVGR
jgi:DHA2 family multidrug resistance protein